MTLSRDRKFGGLLNGSVKSGSSTFSWNNYPLDLTATVFASPVAVNLAEATAALRAITVTNPARHEVLAPAFLLELRDLPKMVQFGGRVLSSSRREFKALRQSWRVARREAGNFSQAFTTEEFMSMFEQRLLDSLDDTVLGIFKAAAAANLALQFGWEPLLSDLKKMAGFENAVARRRKEINNLYSGTGLKRKVELQNSLLEKTSVVTIHSQLGTVNAVVSAKSQTRQWVTVAYKPRTPLHLPPTDTELMRQIYGLTVHGVTASAWEVLRWSWLIDWFSNIGDVLDYSNNELDVNTRVNVMTHVRQQAKFPTTVGTGKLVSAYQWTKESKKRNKGLPDLGAISVKLPFLGANQLSILGSLALLQGKR
ncbi:TPA_asm: maturation protein [ssRNA phage Gerhypos.1_44]|uniref:Maturation protein n=2 Tax=Leviviricetes TaxID=2842243 RepID=A0A8S5KXY9_9VIRU|nr:maturation protein [ssRNA phage Gerhypos.1_44]DAD50036.1 TPA_asm: maturation protein [ssRNA phage Gerhypos.1_44]